MGYAHLLSNLGRREEAVGQARQAVSLDPLPPLINTLASNFSVLGGHASEARQGSEKAGLDPDFWTALLSRSSTKVSAGADAGAIAALRRASAPVGQALTKLRIGADASQRFGRSNLHYSVGYSYEFVERIEDIRVQGVQYGNINTDNQYLRVSLRYDYSPTLSVRAFANRRTGNGLVNSDVRAIDPSQTRELWYQHDRLLQYNYAIAGLGLTWHVNEQWSVSASAATRVWVRVNHDMKYAYELQVLRRF